MFRTTVTYKFTEGGIEHDSVTENEDMNMHNACVHGMIQGLVYSGPITIVKMESKEISNEG